MFIRRAVASTLVDAQMAVRTGTWIPVRGCDPTRAMEKVEAILLTSASDDAIAAAGDTLMAIMQEAVMAGDCQAFGHEQYMLSDAYPRLEAMIPQDAVAAANDDTAPLRRAA